MQIIIMAGGEGTRLRPMTCEIPKPLAKICQKPVLMYILELLKNNSFNNATLTLMYKSDMIKDAFDDDIYNGVRLNYFVEKEPLGTAGCVKNACSDDEVLVISGDAMCDFDLQKAVEYHRKNKADVTIIVKKVIDPREYGLVVYDDKGRINGFLEKPSYESCSTDMANTGVYILSKTALDCIEKGRKLDFAADVFPLMMKNNYKLYAYEENGYWCDIGDFDSYLKCHKDVLDNKIKCDVDGYKNADSTILKCPDDKFNGVKIIPPVYIGKNVRIGIGSIIESGTVISDNVSIGECTRISGSVIHENVFIGDRVNCVNSVVCRNAKVLKESSIENNSVVGENSVIGENAVVSENVKVWNNKTLENNYNAVCDVKIGNGRSLYLGEDGICGETNGNVSTQTAMILGSTLAGIAKNGSIALGYSSGKVAEAMALAFKSGCMSSGGSVLDFGVCFMPLLSYMMELSGVSCGCFIDGVSVTKLHVLSENGLPVTRKQERKIESGMNRADYPLVKGCDFGNLHDTGGMKFLYENLINNTFVHKYHGFYINIKSNDNIEDMLDKIISARNDYNGCKITVHLTGDNKCVTIYSEDTGYVFYEKLIALCCKISFEKGQDVSLPYHYPEIAEKLAVKYKRKVLRYYNCSCDETDKEARTYANKSRFVRDGIYLCFMVFDYISEKNVTLKQALQDIPDFYTSAKYVSIKRTPSSLLKDICKERKGLGEGVVINDEKKGRVLIRPVKAGKGVMLFAESYKSETAAELCQSVEYMIRNKDNID